MGKSRIAKLEEEALRALKELMIAQENVEQLKKAVANAKAAASLKEKVFRRADAELTDAKYSASAARR